MSDISKQDNIGNKYIHINVLEELLTILNQYDNINIEDITVEEIEMIEKVIETTTNYIKDIKQEDIKMAQENRINNMKAFVLGYNK